MITWVFMTSARSDNVEATSQIECRKQALTYRQWLKQGIQQSPQLSRSLALLSRSGTCRLCPCSRTVRNAVNLVQECDSSYECPAPVSVNAVGLLNGRSPCQVYLDDPFVCPVATLSSPGSPTNLPLPSHPLISSSPSATSFLAFVLFLRDVLQVFRLCVCPFWISLTF